MMGSIANSQGFKRAALTESRPATFSCEQATGALGRLTFEQVGNRSGN